MGDGYSKSFSAIQRADQFNGKKIRKYKCVGHVQKHLGTALFKAKSQLRGKSYQMVSVDGGD